MHNNARLLHNNNHSVQYSGEVFQDVFLLGGVLKFVSETVNIHSMVALKPIISMFIELFSQIHFLFFSNLCIEFVVEKRFSIERHDRVVSSPPFYS